MGLHTGDIESTGADVIGYAINRTARIAAVAHGGQVLLSDTTRALVDGTPAGRPGPARPRRAPAQGPARTGAPGPAGHRRPARRLPAPRSLDARPNNLPTQLTTFVGRDKELGEAVALLGGTRLLTLTGPGGTGKTRLSLQVAAAAADDFPDGIWFVPLEPVRVPEFVAPTIARALGVADSRNRPAIDTLADHIGEQRMLLVLDNFEQVVSAGSSVADLLRRCPNLACLVTTRIALRVSGEQEYPVPGLPAPPDTSRLSEVDRLNLPRALREYDLDTLNQFEAVRLFIARASAVKPGFAVTNANAPAVAAISARLHGMPLAIELAAARIKLLSPDQILARLEHHLALLTAGSRDVPERQQTLRGAIAWSYDLLDDGAKLLVDRLSVFRGGCELEMAETVCGPADELGVDVFEGLGALVDQSLVRIDEMAGGEPRFVMLDTIREFAAEMLAARGETDLLASRHAHAMLDPGRARRPEPDRRRAADVARPARARPRQPARGARMGDGPARTRARGADGVRPVAVLAAARLPQRGAHSASRPWPSRAGAWTPSARPGSPRASGASPTGRRTTRPPSAGTGSSCGSGASSATSARSPTRSTTTPTPTSCRSWA